MKNERFMCWQVSVKYHIKRKYHHFSSLHKALHFVHIWTKKYMDDTGYYPVGSTNIIFRVFAEGTKPSQLDGRPLGEEQ
tara:strand:- start:66 stop:302 length:237 start_codon:yes stop_codon:yes gene_type:complete